MLRDQGMMAETWKKLKYKVLPPYDNPAEIASVLHQIFRKKSDHVWVGNIPEEEWLDLFRVAGWFEAPEAVRKYSIQQLLNAVMVLAQRITTMGMEPEIVSKMPAMDDLNSPFMSLNRELMQYVEYCIRHPNHQRHNGAEHEKTRALVRACERVIVHLRHNKERFGVSIRLTQLVVRMDQHIRRLKALLVLLQHPDQERRQLQAIRLFKEVVKNEKTRFSLVRHMSDNLSMLAFRVVEHTSVRGENYVVDSRRSYALILRAALGAGIVVAFLCVFKLRIHEVDKMPPIGFAFLYSLNYALGFMLIHLLRFTLATKQPAMTASTIARSLDHHRISTDPDMTRSVALITQAIRGQFISLVGNVAMVFPVAVGLAWLWQFLLGMPISPAENARHMIGDLHPWRSLSLIHAAIAGVFLMTSGLIAGFYDNKIVYDNIPERIRQHPWLRRLLPPRLLIRLSEYVRTNLGALAGNFYLGLLLGSMATVGNILGLPLDIRHVTFAAGNFGLALVSLGFEVPPWQWAVTILGILGIGAVNVLTSFGLSITIALKSRNIQAKTAHHLYYLLFRHFVRRPWEFFLPFSFKPRYAVSASAVIPAPGETATQEVGMRKAG